MNLTWTEAANRYHEFCLKAATDENVFSTFRGNPIFTQIMEHFNQEQGERYFNVIKRDNPWLIGYFDKFETSEKFGSPLVFEYEGLLLSPSTLRYVKILSDLVKYFGNLGRFKITEIGGGYGGQCKVIKDVYEVDYHMIDLPGVNLLSEKFLTKTGKDNIRFSTWDTLSKENYDLVISIGAFLELNREIQDHYNEMIISGSSRGYMIGSVILNPNNCYQIEDFKKMGNVVFADEEPNTHPTNFMMYWKEKYE
jgi:hypothetical protein